MAGIDIFKLVIAAALVACGIVGYYWLSESALVLRVLAVAAGLLAGAAVATISAPGREFVVFAQEAIGGGDGAVPLGERQDAGVGSLRPGSRMEKNLKQSESGKRWYVVHAYSGFEKSVQRALEDRISRAGMQDKFGKILVPVEEVVEMKGGQKHMSERKFFPGYVLVEMEMNDDTWHLVKNTNKVTGFVGGSAMRPTPISEKEVNAIMQQMREGVEKPKPKVLFEVGEMVRVKDGPFTDFQGTVEDVNYEKSRLRVAVTIFGRSTPVELEFGQVEKA